MVGTALRPTTARLPEFANAVRGVGNGDRRTFHPSIMNDREVKTVLTGLT